MEKMRAIMKLEPGPGAVLGELPLPKPGPGEVLVKTEMMAICGTDVHFYEWNKWAETINVRWPMVLGHEFTGTVVEIGPGVRGVQIGDTVSGETHIPCGNCYHCLNGEQHICSNLITFGMQTPGCFAEYAVLPEVCAVKVDKGIDPAVRANFEPLGVAVHAVDKAGVGGNTVAIIGCGPIGLFSAAVARALGAARIFASDISAYRLDLARKIGVDYTLNPKETDLTEFVRAHTPFGVGVDVLLETSGNADAFMAGFRYLRKGGRVVAVGLASKPLQLEVGRDIAWKEATIIGIHGREMFKTWQQMEKLIAGGRLDITPLLTHTFQLKDYKEALETALSGQAGKVLLAP
ncbi:MAG TPA: L-threonine 3-dehydrogenase [Firmicutes bacterium]|nr:L-threonine 3-dehydrogenase [Bacillota bacterium]